MLKLDQTNRIIAKVKRVTSQIVNTQGTLLTRRKIGKLHSYQVLHQLLLISPWHQLSTNRYQFSEVDLSWDFSLLPNKFINSMGCKQNFHNEKSKENEIYTSLKIWSSKKGNQSNRKFMPLKTSDGGNLMSLNKIITLEVLVW